MKVRVTGEQRAIAVLKAFDRDNFKVIDKGLKEAGEVLRDEVRDKTPNGAPLSNWGRWNATRTSKAGVSSTRDLSYNATKVRTGIKVTTKQSKKVSTGGKFQVAVATMSPAGAMYALAGSVRKRYKREPSYRGRSFVDNINNASGKKYARGMNEAMKNKPVVAKAKEKVTEVIREAERKADRILGGRR
jgi:membrane-bound inhibitor of C-type lysozyme